MANRRYHCDERYFERLTSDSAYWVGFIAADGCIHIRKRHSNNQFMLQLSSAIADRKHLKTFLDCLKSNHPILNAGKGCLSLQIGSYPLCIQLEQFGVTPRKSYSLRLVRPTDPTLLFAMLRGIVDGDGSFGLYGASYQKLKNNGIGRPVVLGRKYVRIYVVGSRDVCEMFKEIFSFGSVSKKAGVFQWQTAGAKALAVLRKLYVEYEGVALPRKRDLAVKLLKERAV